MADAKKPAAQKDNGITPIKKSFLGGHKKMVVGLVAAVAVIVIILALIAVYVQGQIKQLVAPVNVISGPISGSLSMTSHGMLTYNYSNYLAGYAKVHYFQSNATNATLSLTIYSSNPAEPVYLVNVGGYCVQCFIGSSLLKDLNSSMHTYGLINNQSSLNYIDINKLNELPPGVIVIIPSGLMPTALLPNVTYSEKCPSYSNVTVVSMLSEGDTIVYVGDNFTRSVSCSGQIALNSNRSISTLIPFMNDTPRNNTQSKLHFNSPTFYLGPGNSYGKVTEAHILNGTLIALSNYPSVGWNYSAAYLASDISMVLESRFWMAPLATGSMNLSTFSDQGNATVFTINTHITYAPQVSTQVNDSFALLRLNLSNKNAFQELEIPFRYTLRQNGLIGMPAVTGLSQPTQISAQVFNASSSATIITFVPILTSNLTNATTSPVRIGQTGPTALFTYPSLYLKSGYYIAKLMDQQGNTYSYALFYVDNSTISPSSLDFKNTSFRFTATSNGQPINGVSYKVNINGAYNGTGVIDGGSIVYNLPSGVSIGYGTGYFNFEIMGRNYSMPYSYTNPNAVRIPPLYIAFVIAAIIIVVLNKVLIPPNVEEYYIDVPDVKPQKLEHASESVDSIIAVFDRVNIFYRWVHMPLTAEEVKAGISSNIKYGNTRMSITIRNTYSILNALLQKGVVQMADDYYAPTRWIKESGYSIEYLVVYRKLRDYCIANAMFITELGVSSNADVIVTSKGTQTYVKIYSKGVKSSSIEVSQKIRTFIVFIDMEARLNFLNELYKSYGSNAQILKIAIAYGNVKLIDSDDLGELKL
jgi:hypothetical protein